MRVFKTDKTLYLTNELKSWAWAIVSVLLFYFGAALFFYAPQDKLFVGVTLIFLFKLGETLTPYHVKEIQIEAEKNRLIFILDSILSGQRNKIHELQQTRSELIHSAGLTGALSSTLTLQIHLPGKEVYRITGRYGFPAKTLAEIHNALKSRDVLVATP